MLPELFKNFPDLIKSNSDTVLAGLAITGVVTTAYLSGKASFKAAEVIKEAEVVWDVVPDDQGTGTAKGIETKQELPTKEKLRLTWHLYIPAASLGATTIASIVMANRITSKKIAALTMASSISDRALKEYKEKIIEKFGDKKSVEVREGIAKDRIQSTDGSTEVIITGEGNVLCFDMLTGRYFESTVEKIRQAMNTVNYRIIQHNYESLSVFYDELGLTPTSYSDTVGWNADHLIEVQFSTVMSKDNRPCVAVDFLEYPTPEYTKMW